MAACNPDADDSATCGDDEARSPEVEGCLEVGGRAGTAGVHDPGSLRCNGCAFMPERHTAKDVGAGDSDPARSESHGTESVEITQDAFARIVVDIEQIADGS